MDSFNKADGTVPSANGGCTVGNNDDKSLTFRKRRLSLTLQNNNRLPYEHNNNDELDDDNRVDAVHLSTSSNGNTNGTIFVAENKQNDNDEKAQTFRKRRLSLTTTSSNTIITMTSVAKSGEEKNGGKTDHRRSSIDSHSSIASSSIGSHETNLVSRTLHAGELVSANGASPPSPAHGPSFSNQFLYQPTPSKLPPANDFKLGATIESQSLNNNRNHTNETIPKWKRRHTFDNLDSSDHHKLPFTRDVVGTYSCHGVEPVFDYENDEEVAIQQLNGSDLDAAQQHHVPTPVTVAKINQDRGGVVCPYGNHPKTALFAVYDGHGHGGELVSQFALYEIQRRLEKHPTFDTDIEKAMKETFLAVDDALIDEPLINPMFAGTTACVVLLQDQRLTIANVGDSRAVCARKLPNVATKTLGDGSTISTAYSALDLSFDQNPDVPMEMYRIQKAGGFVTLSPGPGLSSRVWLDPQCTQIGLAMARSIGDHAIATVGVIAEPVVTYHDISDDDEFIIVASDGVWEFLDSSDAVNIVGQNLHRGATKACQALIEAAAARWFEEEGAYRDDITAIVVKLNELWKSNGKRRKVKSKR